MCCLVSESKVFKIPRIKYLAPMLEEARKVQHHPEFALVQNSNRNRLTPKLRQRYTQPI